MSATILSSGCVVIVGAGHAAGQACASLRQEGWQGRIVLIGDEPYLPYQRPPLSKKFLQGEFEEHRLFVKPEAFYQQQNIECHLGVRAIRIDHEKRQVATDDGKFFDFDRLIIATGATPRKISIPGIDVDGVCELRSMGDALDLRARLSANSKLVIIGAGYIGLEVAATARALGASVTVVEAADRVLSRVTGPEMSRFFQNLHREQGVDIRLGETVTEFQSKDGVLTACRLSNGEILQATIAVVGVGVTPNVSIAEQAALPVKNGIVVDEYARTIDPQIYAIGDCSNHPSALLDRRIRLESVPNALDQAKTAAAAICGKDKPYNQTPWFWSDQYDVKLQTAGLCEGYDQLLFRGDPAAHKFSASYLKGDVLIAVDAVNSPADFLPAKKLIADKAQINRAKFDDPEIPYKDCFG